MIHYLAHYLIARAIWRELFAGHGVLLAVGAGVVLLVLALCWRGSTAYYRRQYWRERSRELRDRRRRSR